MITEWKSERILKYIQVKYIFCKKLGMNQAAYITDDEDFIKYVCIKNSQLFSNSHSHLYLDIYIWIKKTPHIWRCKFSHEYLSWRQCKETSHEQTSINTTAVSRRNKETGAGLWNDLTWSWVDWRGFYLYKGRGQISVGFILVAIIPSHNLYSGGWPFGTLFQERQGRKTLCSQSAYENLFSNKQALLFNEEFCGTQET